MEAYRVTVPFVGDMGSVLPFDVFSTPIKTAKEMALLHINDMRDHDGLPHLTRMPKGTTYKKIKG